MRIWDSFDSSRYRNLSTGQRNYSGKFQNKDVVAYYTGSLGEHSIGVALNSEEVPQKAA